MVCSFSLGGVGGRRRGSVRFRWVGFGGRWAGVGSAGLVRVGGCGRGVGWVGWVGGSWVGGGGSWVGGVGRRVGVGVVGGLGRRGWVRTKEARPRERHGRTWEPQTLGGCQGWATALCVGGCMVEQAAPDWSVSRTRRPEALNHLAQRMIHKLSRFPAPYRPNGSNGPQIRRTAPYIQAVCVPLTDCGGCNVPGSVRGTLPSYILELLIQLIHLMDFRGSNWFGRGSFCFLRLIQTDP